MREIFFRGKCVDTDRWYEGQYIHLHKTTFCFTSDYDKYPDNDIHQIVFEHMTDWGLPNQHMRADVKPETVGQYTGLRDKKGKMVFEGDILDIGGDYYACFWDDGNFEFGLMNRKESFGIAYISPACIEVVGNIHDNPEVMEGKDES